MRVALAVLCIGAVTFLLRVLLALIKEVMNQPRGVQVYFARFNPSRQQELILVNPEFRLRHSAAEVGARISHVVMPMVGLLAIELICGEPLCKMLFGSL